MSSTIKKKVTLCETSIVDLNTERKDRQDARWIDPASRKTKKEKSSRQIQSKLALTIYIVRELSIVCVKCYFTLTKKIVMMF